MAETTTTAKYTLTDEMKKYFCSVLLLENMINFKDKYNIVLEGDAKYLEPFLVYMHSKGYVTINEDHYAPTKKGGEVLKNYLTKLEEFRSVYRIYSAVDTGEGEFAFSKYFDFDTDEDFEEHLNDERFVDLRIALCELKGINPLEIIFLEFVDGDAFDTSEPGWELGLATGSVWSEMLGIANENIYIDDLTEEGFTGEEVMREVVKEGSKIMTELVIRQAEFDEEEAARLAEEEDDDFDDLHEDEIEVVTYEIEYIEEPIFAYDYYDVYYDPYYCSPCWNTYYY